MTPQGMEELPVPPSIETGQMFQESETPNGESGKEHYRPAESRCYNCAHFSDPNKCAKGVNGGSVDPEAGCDLFQMAGETEEDEATETPAEEAVPPGIERG